MTYRLLGFGIYSSLFYVGMNIVVPLYFDGYSYRNHTVSELSAIDAPTRVLWLMLAAIYNIMFAAFSWGVWKSAGKVRRLRITALFMMVYCVLNVYWPPMHLRGVTPTLTDTLHVVWTMVTVLMMLLMMITGASVFGKRFRWYTGITIVFNIFFGFLASLYAPDIPLNGPTPMMGVWERINIGVFMLWIVVLTITLRQAGGCLEQRWNLSAGRS